MRWFKHEAASRQDAAIAQLEELSGMEGIGRWWRVCELVAGEMEPGSLRCWIALPWRGWEQALIGRRRKLAGFFADLDAVGLGIAAGIDLRASRAALERLGDEAKIDANDVATAQQSIANLLATEWQPVGDAVGSGSVIVCAVPKLLNWLDEYTKKSGAGPKSLRPEKKRGEKNRGEGGSLRSPARSSAADTPDSEPAAATPPRTSLTLVPEDRPPVIVRTLPTTPRDPDFEVTADQVAEWAQAYPALDVVNHLDRMTQWLRANPSKTKTLRGMPRFCTSWLEREQNKGGDRGPGGGRAAGPSGIPFHTQNNRAALEAFLGDGEPRPAGPARTPFHHRENVEAPTRALEEGPPRGDA